MDRKDFLRYSGMGMAFSLLGNSSFFLSSCGKSNMMDMMGGGPVNIIEGAFDVPLPLPITTGGWVQLTAQVTDQIINVRREQIGEHRLQRDAVTARCRILAELHEHRYPHGQWPLYRIEVMPHAPQGSRHPALLIRARLAAIPSKSDGSVLMKPSRRS